MANTPALMSTGEAARHLQVSDETVRRWVKAGLLTHLVLPSGRLRFRMADLDAVMQPVTARDAEAVAS